MTLQETPASHPYKRLLTYAFQYKSFFVIGLFGFLLFAAMESLLVLSAEFFFDALQGETSNRLSFLPESTAQNIMFVPGLVVVLAIVRGIGAFLGNFFISRVGLNVVNDLRKQVFAHMIYLPQSFFDSRNSGELISLIIYNIEQVTKSVTEAIKIFFRDGLSVTFYLALLLYLNWKLTLVFFAVAPILAGLIYIASKYFLRVSRKIQKAVGRVTHIATESIQGIRLVKSFLGEGYEHKRFAQAADENLRFSTKFERVKAMQTPILHIIIASAIAVIMLLVLLFWQDSSGAAIAYISAAGAIAKPFRSLTTLNAVIQKGVAAAETIFATLDLPREEDKGVQPLVDFKGKIEFKNVDFSYNNLDDKAIKNLNFKIEPNETIALVGQSGSGKSTLASLLLRFYDIDSGEILIDDTPIKKLPLSNLRANIALVDQHSVLFNDSVKNNIAYGLGLENKAEADISFAATNAYASQFIEELENGFETSIGEAGDLLSGGQKQRITIARAFLKNAPILILDEATSALDNESEKKVHAALDKLKSGRTTIIIAHRLSTIENADKIAVLDKGKLVEFGDHKSLISRKGYYAELFRKGFSSETPENQTL